ncbi:MAG: hypothetical protein ACRC01_12500, partial [Deefgea sp.]
MSELIAYIAPQNVLPALSDCLLILNSSNTHLNVMQADDDAIVQQHYVLPMPVQRLVFPPANCHWLIASLSNEAHPPIHNKNSSLVVSAVGLCSNHLDLARSL